MDGRILQAVREIVGEGCPVYAVLDQHCNVSEAMVTPATAILVERTYPHTDMALRARDAVVLMMRELRGEVRPVMAWRSIPLLWNAPRMITAHQPARSYVEAIEATDLVTGVVGASVGVGYQWQDSPAVGASAIVLADGDGALAQDQADALARKLWDMRERWVQAPLTPQSALAQGEKLGKFPILLADQGDNTGGGAPGDATHILRLFKERKLDEHGSAVVMYVVDAESAALATKAGVGATISLSIGGKSDARLGPPVEFEKARVVALSDGRFVYEGPMWNGKQEDLGQSAWVEQDGLSVVLITRAQQPIDTTFIRSLGMDVSKFKYVCVKSTGHFRSGVQLGPPPRATDTRNKDTASVLTDTPPRRALPWGAQSDS